MPDHTSQSATDNLNQLYYGDCLEILRNLPDASVDLIYLDPPFNSKRQYNAFFKGPAGTEIAAQIMAFEDTWHWGRQAEDEFLALLKNPQGGRISEVITALRSFLKENDMMAYLVMMASRLVELHRVLKDTGSLYLHCDPTASHYLKIILDSIFDIKNFQNEIIWKRTSAHSNVSRRFGRNYDSILFYAYENSTWNTIFLNYPKQYLQQRYKYTDERGQYMDDNLKNLDENGYKYSYKGVEGVWRCPLEKMQELDRDNRLFFTQNGGIRIKRYLHEVHGIECGAVWTDIFPVNSQAKERLGYPTQKPMALLERIISASSNPGDVVLDPFCGCGTAIHAAQKLGRKWIGIDITHLAIALIKQRMHKAFPNAPFQVIGTPKDVENARFLAQTSGLDGRYQFQFWALSLIDALPAQNKKKGADGGIDGYIWAYDSADSKAKPFKIIVSVKSGKIPANHIRELNGLIQTSKDNTQMAVLLTLEEPSKKMLAEAFAAGVYTYPNGKQFPRMQILTIADILENNKKLDYLDYGEQRGMNRQIKREPQQGSEQNLL